jgi:hypothetical protein
VKRHHDFWCQRKKADAFSAVFKMPHANGTPTNIQILLPGDGHCDRMLDLRQQIGTAGNLVTDAQLAALAIEHHAVLHTADTDFLRFPGLRWHNPITGVGSETLRKGRRG